MLRPQQPLQIQFGRWIGQVLSWLLIIVSKRGVNFSFVLRNKVLFQLKNQNRTKSKNGERQFDFFEIKKETNARLLEDSREVLDIQKTVVPRCCWLPKFVFLFDPKAVVFF